MMNSVIGSLNCPFPDVERRAEARRGRAKADRPTQRGGGQPRRGGEAAAVVQEAEERSPCYVVGATHVKQVKTAHADVVGASSSRACRANGQEPQKVFRSSEGEPQPLESQPPELPTVWTMEQRVTSNGRRYKQAPF